MNTTSGQKPRLLDRALAQRRKLGISFALLAALLVALLWPFVLIVLKKGHLGWVTLSNVGQAYGVLSAIALVGVAASIFFQARGEYAQRVQMVRDYHLELRRMALDNPEVYMPCWRPVRAPNLDLTGRQQHLYLHLTMTFAWMSYSIGVMSDKALEDLCVGIFKGEAGRTYWDYEKETWQPLPGNRRRQKFVELVENARDNAGPIEMGRTIDSDPDVTPSTFTKTVVNVATAALTGLSTGVLLASMLRRPGNRS